MNLQISESQYSDTEDNDDHTHTYKYRASGLTMAGQTHAARQLVESLLLFFIGPLLAER